MPEFWQVGAVWYELASVDHLVREFEDPLDPGVQTDEPLATP